MKIGFVLDHYDPTRGGAEASSHALLRELAARGAEVRVYCREFRAAEPLPVVVVPRRGLRRGVRERRFAEDSVARAREDGVDVVYAVRHVLDADLYHPHGGSWAATLEGRRRAQPVPGAIESLRALTSRRRYFAFADREVFARNPGLPTVAVSKLVAEDLRLRFAEFRPDVHVVWPTLPAVQDDGRPDDSPWRALGGARTKKLLFVAHDPVLKGLGALLPALAELRRREPAVRLAVVGRRATRFSRLATRLGLGPHVNFVGASSRVRAFLRAADVLVHPTFYDPCALVSLEALAEGTAVVTTRHDGAAEFVRTAGAVVDEPRDPVALAEALAEVLERSASLADAARDCVRGLDRSRQVEAMESLLRRAADHRRAKR